MRRPRRAFLLAMVLFIVLVVVILGLGFLTSRQNRYTGSVRAVSFARAKSLAEAGMEDARVKLERDINFPPAVSVDSPVFSYQERFLDVVGNPLGYYTVTIDSTYAVAPYYVLRVTSTGNGGLVVGEPRSSCSINAVFDVYPPGLAGDAKRQGNPPPNFYRIISWTEDEE